MENNARLRWKALGEKILQASRNELYLSMRFLDTAFAKLPYVMNQKTFFLGTDGISIQYNARFLAERYEFDRRLVNRAYLHTILHCLFRHMYHKQERDEEVWNLSCDIAVEYVIDQLEFACVQKLISDQRQEAYDTLLSKLSVLTAEGVYRCLMDESYTDSMRMKLSVEFLVDDHVFWEQAGEEERQDEGDSGNQPEDQNDQEDPSSDDQNQSQNQAEQQKQEEDWKDISEKMETNLDTFMKGIGSETQNLRAVLQAANRTRYDYKSFLRKFAQLTECIRIDEDSFDYAYYSYGLSLYHNIPLLEALEYKEEFAITEFVIALDTSGSCSGELIRAFLQQTAAILKSTESFASKICLHIIQCDQQIQQDLVITSLEELDSKLEEFEVRGFGGTDFRPVFEYVEQLKREKKLIRPKGLIYFTDGYGTFPEHPTEYDTAFVFLREDYTDANVPSWAMKLILDPEDL